MHHTTTKQRVPIILYRYSLQFYCIIGLHKWTFNVIIPQIISVRRFGVPNGYTVGYIILSPAHQIYMIDSCKSTPALAYFPW